ALARYNPDGTPDTTFGSFGVQVESTTTGWDGSGVTVTNTGTGNAITTDFDSNEQLAGSSAQTYHYADSASAVAIDSQNRILVLGSSGQYFNTGEYPYLLRYNVNGQLDTTFNGTGFISDLNGDQGASVIATDASDRVVVARTDSANPGAVDVLRFAAN